MSLINCKFLRAVVIFAGVLFLLGIALQAPRALLSSDFATITTLLSGTGLLAMVLSPVIMLSMGLLVLFPGVSRSLHLCQR
jgi:hypothetical protein